MDRSNTQNNSRNFGQIAKRTAALLCVALAGLSLAPRTGAQTGPLTNSPGVPTAYQSPLFHSGGAVDPSLLGVPPFLYGQLQGTPTGPVTVGGVTIQTQIPSFLLGAYRPNLPPTTALAYYPEHFADGDPPTTWAAPFVYASLTQGNVSVDDNAAAFTPAPVATPGFTQIGGWQQITTTQSPAAGTAINGEYLRVQSDVSGSVATWQMVEQYAGNYNVLFNIPSDVPDVNGVTELRSNQVTYTVTVRDSTGAVTSTGNAIVSQTEANSNQFLAGPFQVQAGGTVTVILACDQNSRTNYQANNPYYIVADQMLLQKASGDVQSTPTAINYDSYPTDFNQLQYWGAFIQQTATVTNLLNPVPTAAQGIIPDTKDGLGWTSASTSPPILHYGQKGKPVDETGAPDPRRRIRQVVYFGRLEPTFNRTTNVDDSAATGFSSSFSSPLNGQPSAINQEYRRAAVIQATNIASATATAVWTLTTPAPTGAAATNYFVTVHVPGTPVAISPAPQEKRIGRATYTVTVNGVVSPPVTINQITGTADTNVVLPTGPILLNPGQIVTVTLYNISGDTATVPANSYVVADSVTLATPATRGAIYCVDGFTGSVIWRFETPSSANGPSAPVYSSPAVAKIHVLVAPAVRATNTPAIYADKLVVIVGDNNGLVYCLDAMGNGDGTANSAVLDQDLQPIYVPQPSYAPLDANGNRDTVDPVTGNPIPAIVRPDPTKALGAPGYTPHVGTTSVYWVYRPDANRPKQVVGTTNVGKVKATDVTSDLPVPAAFNTSSPTIYVDPNRAALNPASANGNVPIPADNSVPSDAIVYVGNSNGVLYALDATGSGIDGTDQASFYNSGDLAQPIPTLRNAGDRFNASLDIRQTPGVFPAVPTDAIVPTTSPLWWFTLRGPDPNAGDTFADIESAPAIYVKKTTPSVAVPPNPSGFDYAPTVYIGSSHEQESTSNIGRLYALNGLYGPSGNSGSSDPRHIDPTITSPPATAYGGPGSPGYNVAQTPKLPTVAGVADTTDWSFPDGYGTQPNTINSSQKVRPALGNISGSPVVFTNTHESNAALQTRIYFAANSGLEIAAGSPNGTAAAARPDETQTGRIWAVNLDGSVGTTTNSGAAVNASGNNVWSYPLANDPNNAAKDTVAEPNAPIGAFLHATPAIGYVQYPSESDNAFPGGTGPNTDVINNSATGVLGQVVPMLYVGTRGTTDTGLYYIDIDGDATIGNPGTTRRHIYRVPSPDGSIFQCSPALITNSTTAGGNGGAVFITAGNTFYDFSATPLSNFNAAQNFRLVRLNNQYTNMGPISSPIVSACDVSDLNGTPPIAGSTANVTDWVYVGDTLDGICYGFTPHDLTDAAIPSDLDAIVPTSFAPVTPVDLTVSLQAYLVAESDKDNVSSATPPALPIGTGTALPVYEWGQNVYIRFANVIPPALSGATTPVLFYDHTKPLGPGSTAYGNGGPVEFDLSDVTPNADGTAVAQPDHAIIPAILNTAPGGGQALPNGFYLANPLNSSFNLQTVGASPSQYIAAYTYTIADGSARLNTPGSRRQIQNAHQNVEVYTTTDGINFTDTGRTTQIAATISNGNVVSNAATRNARGQITSYNTTNTPVAGQDQPTFGILNPLAVRGGGINLLSPNTQAVQVGDEVGPFGGVATSLQNPSTDLEALANGNDIPVTAPPSSAGGNGAINPAEPLDIAATAFNPPTVPKVVVTSTGLIPHNTDGDNSDNPAVGATLPIGVYPNDILPTQNFGVPGMPFAADASDRSALSLLGQTIRIKAGTLSGGIGALVWNDNTGDFNSTHDSVVNYLPWETPPSTAGYRNGGIANSSADYPDISPTHISAYVYRAPNAPEDLTLGDGYLNPTVINKANTTNAVQARQVFLNPLQFHISIPHWQPANQQIYQRFTNQTSYASSGEAAPLTATGANNITGNAVFPMGYVTTRRIYIPQQNGVYRPGAAFREIRIYTGVPPDYGLQMGQNTVDIGQTVPSAFGVQTGLFTAYTNGANTDFNPYNTAFHDYYQQLPIYNTGNVNLINVHLDQRISLDDKPNTSNDIIPLVLSSDSNELLSYIPAWDVFGITGANKLTGKNNYLVRSSLDADIAVMNPGIGPLSGYAGQYPGPTFHKARVGDANPTQMTVPDVPRDNNVNSAFYVPTDLPGDGKPAASTALPFASNAAAPPYVSVAIPFGTPVGTYHLPKTIQAFEGYDNPLTYNPLYPPFYGGILPGQGKAATLPTHDFLVAPQPPAVGPFVKGSPGQHPVSSNGTDIKVSVVEDRMTDGFTYGGLPMIDFGPAVAAVNPNPARSTPDFAPAAFRDPLTGNLSMYWTTGRNGGFGIQAANVTMNQTPAVPNGVPYFEPPTGGQAWWSSFNSPSLPSGTNSGLTIAQDVTDPTSVFSFFVNVQANPPTVPYQNTLWCYPVQHATGFLSNTGQVITNDPSQVKYGVKGLYFKSNSGFTNNLWAFWTTTVRGRTAINYNSNAAPGTAVWPLTTGSLPIPAGLTAVSDPAPLLVAVPPTSGTALVPAISVTYSGTGPDGNIDLYESRYQQDSKAATKLDLIPFPDIVEILAPTGKPGGWLQARDVAWARNGALNLSVKYVQSGNTTVISPILYNAGTPLFSRAVFDKASGYLVLTGVSVPSELPDAQGTTLHTVYVDYATGRVRFSPALRLTTAALGSQTYEVRALFDPLARRITTDSRADIGPITFLDAGHKVNETGPSSNPVPNGTQPNVVETDRRWYIWRKSGTGGAGPSATLYYKTQRLTAFLPKPILLNAQGQAVNLTATVNGVTVYNSATVNGGGAGQADIDAARGRVYFQQYANSQFSEGQQFTVTYTDINNIVQPVTDTIQWQDEERGNVNPAPIDTATGLNSVYDTQLPISKVVNEDNVSAFLDPFVYSAKNSDSEIGAGRGAEHKIWLFWNSTRNAIADPTGTADVYYETINPLFSALP